jgi:drug/metabolite transporter (DMT)-like permease
LWQSDLQIQALIYIGFSTNTMNKFQLAFYTVLTMIAFSGNSILCRLALKETSIDAASYTSIRLLSGAVMLSILLYLQRKPPLKQGTWKGATALFIYAVALSFAYRSINAGAGALILFGAVQLTMILVGFISGERMSSIQTMGFVGALIGVVLLVIPNTEAPSILDSILMVVSGIAWGIYSLIGRRQSEPITATAGNFLRAVLLTIIMSTFTLPWLQLDTKGIYYAILSGAVTSGMGYVLWYRILQHMSAITASTIQLTSPLLTAIGGVLLLGEAFTRNLLFASLLILGGIKLVLRSRKP